MREKKKERQMWGRGARKGRLHGLHISLLHSPVVFELIRRPVINNIILLYEK